jgi:hypothetical protein
MYQVINTMIPQTIIKIAIAFTHINPVEIFFLLADKKITNEAITRQTPIANTAGILIPTTLIGTSTPLSGKMVLVAMKDRLHTQYIIRMPARLRIAEIR